jgi:hypothetical protein
MARNVKNTKIDSRSARSKLPKRREPYWTVISAGCAIGYRNGAKGGTWIARVRGDDGSQHYDALGAADDARDADGLTCFTFAQAQERARTFFGWKARELAGHSESQAGPYTVDGRVKTFRPRETGDATSTWHVVTIASWNRRGLRGPPSAIWWCRWTRRCAPLTSGSPR